MECSTPPGCPQRTQRASSLDLWESACIVQRKFLCVRERELTGIERERSMTEAWVCCKSAPEDLSKICLIDSRRSCNSESAEGGGQLMSAPTPACQSPSCSAV
eukprot:5648546-Amphidinium_carterae.3